MSFFSAMVSRLTNYTVGQMAEEAAAHGVVINTTPDAPEYVSPNFTGTINDVYYFQGCSQTISRDDAVSLMGHGEPGCVTFVEYL